jgi:hypothetical protein
VTREALTVHIEPGSTPAAGWVVLTNRGTADLRVWRNGNTWGDEALSFDVSHGGSTRRVEREPQVYTRNVPASVVLTPGDGFQISFDLLDGTWRLDAIGRPLPPQVEIAAVYEVPPSSEAVAHQVWTGLVSSEQVTIPLGTRVR